MELNAEQIKKALECCVSGYCFRDGCPLCENAGDDDIQKCTSELARNTLALIKELTEENKWRKEQYLSMVDSHNRACDTYMTVLVERDNLLIENERLRDTAYRLECEVHRERADTVRKFAEMLTEAAKHYPQRCGDCFKQNIDKIANELIEEEICENS